MPTLGSREEIFSTKYFLNIINNKINKKMTPSGGGKAAENKKQNEILGKISTNRQITKVGIKY